MKGPREAVGRQSGGLPGTPILPKMKKMKIMKNEWCSSGTGPAEACQPRQAWQGGLCSPGTGKAVNPFDLLVFCFISGSGWS